MVSPPEENGQQHAIPKLLTSVAYLPKWQRNIREAM
jgi:hypothetical protein